MFVIESEQARPANVNGLSGNGLACKTIAALTQDCLILLKRLIIRNRRITYNFRLIFAESLKKDLWDNLAAQSVKYVMIKPIAIIKRTGTTSLPQVTFCGVRLDAENEKYPFLSEFEIDDNKKFLDP